MSLMYTPSFASSIRSQPGSSRIRLVFCAADALGFGGEDAKGAAVLTAPPITMRHRCHTPAVSSMRGSTMPLIMKYHSSGLSDFSMTFERLPLAAASRPG